MSRAHDEHLWTLALQIGLLDSYILFFHFYSDIYVYVIRLNRDSLAFRNMNIKTENRRNASFCKQKYCGYMYFSFSMIQWYSWPTFKFNPCLIL